MFKLTLRENCPNTEFFLVRILLYSVQIRGNTDQKKLRIWTLILDPQCKDVINDEKLDLNGNENKF